MHSIKVAVASTEEGGNMAEKKSVGRKMGNSWWHTVAKQKRMRTRG